MTKRILLFLILFSLVLVQPLSAAPQAELWPRWQEHDPASTQVVDHSAWQAFLDEYPVTDHPSGVNLVRYGSVSETDRKSLDRYLDQLQQTAVTQLNRNEQMAYWFKIRVTIAFLLYGVKGGFKSVMPLGDYRIDINVKCV